jgi:hypothetical protein
MLVGNVKGAEETLFHFFVTKLDAPQLLATPSLIASTGYFVVTIAKQQTKLRLAQRPLQEN